MSNKYSITQYSEEQTKDTRRALLELGEALTPYYDDIVLIGGWVPYLLTEGEDDFHHCGSEDIDLALRICIPNKGKTIRQIIETLGYKQVQEFPHRFCKKKETSGRDNKIQLDFLCEGDKKSHLTVQEDLKAAPFPLIGIAFYFNSEREIRDADGAITASLKVADLVGSLVMKSDYDYEKENKYLYDVFALTWYKGGPKEAAECFKQIVMNKKANKSISEETIEQVKKGVQRIYNTFTRADGAHWVHMFDEQYEYDDVLTRMNLFLEPVLQFLNGFDAGE